MGRIDGTFREVEKQKADMDFIPYRLFSCATLSVASKRALTNKKPPLCKGRWHGNAVTEGL